MNYFELHIGDYEADTAHLSMLEDAAYGRMMRIYYRTERPLPVDVKQVCRLVRATSKPERDAVQQVLSEFFELREDGWHQGRCDAEIADFADGEPERELKKVNEDNRLRRHREERAKLFKIITEAGQHAAWNAPIKDLRDLAARLSETPSATPPATAPATPATATQTPIPTPQTPDTSSSKKNTHTSDAEDVARGPATPAFQPTPAGRICKAMKSLGIADVNPGHPDLLALIDAGATDAEFAGAAATARGKSKGFAYALGALKRQRLEAAATSQAMHKGPLPGPLRPQTAAERRAATMDGLTGRDRNKEPAHGPASADVIDIEARRVE